MPFELLQSETIYRGRAFTIRRDHLRTPDGRITKYDIVVHHGSVVLIPIDEDGNLLFVRQYRHAAREDLLELPAGTLDEGEEPEACARREIREETGLAAAELTCLGGFYLAPGYSTEYMTVYLATGLHPDPLEADADEFLHLEAVPIPEALRMAEDGTIPDAKSLAALFLARPHLERFL
ncbi:MAG: NUDIX hydrolase [Anaerolineae bacterium]|nr:MAG: NUDIX hydrolase [Anaerolineae bacterium]